MTHTVPCLVFSTDAEWSGRMRQNLSVLIPVRPFDSDAQLLVHLGQFQASIVLLDLQTHGVLDLLPVITQQHPDTLILAFGVPGSDPMLEAERSAVYAAEDAALDRRHLITLVRQALGHAALAGENRLLRQETFRLNTVYEESRQAPQPGQDSTLDIRDFSAAMRHFTNVDTLLHRLVDEVANSLGVSRVGIFCRTRDVASYRLRAGLRCPDSAHALDFAETHAHVLWLSAHTHAISRRQLDLIKDSATRLALQSLLDEMGAEVLLPLQAHNRLLGWLFVGHLSTGKPFDDRHLHRLVALTECVSTTLEHALLYEEATIQRTLAETLLHSMPSGIIAVDDNGIVRWYNDSASALLGVTAAIAVGRPIEGLGSRLADLLRRTLGEHGGPQSAEWVDPMTQRNLVTRTQRLTNQTRCLGAVAVIQDTTDQKFMKAKEDRLDRATFWTELAASMSHEVRNPLVAIKTFAQLLPERYLDKEFQNEFRDLVTSEVERLNSIVDQIHTFANPPPLSFKPMPIRRSVDAACARVFPASPAPRHKISIVSPDILPDIMGDERALTEAFVHLLTNAVEALSNTSPGEITVSLHVTGAGPGASPSLLILFKDNGPGIPPDLKDKLFSPFSTTKARGLGLGLPIARRTLLDHQGDLTLHSNDFGVQATVRLPVLSPSPGTPK